MRHRAALDVDVVDRVLDDVERRALLVDPAREDPAELALGVGDIDLDEGPGQLLRLVRRGGLAGAKANDDVVVANRLTGAQGEVAGDPVALVEESDHRDSLAHRRGPGGKPVGRRAHRLRLDLAVGRGLILLAPAAGGEREQAGQRCGGESAAQRQAARSYSGTQAW